jgi:acetoacetyl-CoA synthetase
MGMAERLWQPTPEQARATRLAQFLGRLQERRGLHFADYEALYAWSIERPADFWAELWDYADPVCTQPYREVVDDPARLPGAHWFSGAQLNFAQNLLRVRGPQPALRYVGEAGDARGLSYDELRGEVARVAAGLRELGVGRGDRVAGLLPNLPETVVAMLAAASLGALWTSCSPDFGLEAVRDRFAQVEPVVLFAADGYRYGGRSFETLGAAAALAAQLPGLRRVVGVRSLRAAAPLPADWLAYEELGGRGSGGEPQFEPLPFDHPLYVVYSSGTTGPPKCIVHGAGGTLLQHWKELALHSDVRPGDRVFYFTTCGWMMWNWLVSVLALGACAVLYDGSPFHPGPQRLFELAAAERLALFGTSARFLAAAERAGANARGLDLAPLRSLLSTGSPLSPEGFRYVYRELKRDLRLSSISGGTDILSCFFGGNPLGAVHAGELQCRSLAMRVEAWNERGEAVFGEKGELVCTAAFPSVPLGFWNDPDGRRFRDAYFVRYPGVWAHGDFVELRPGGGAVVHGRSDATLNPGGVRIGTAELYRVVESMPEIEDSIAVAQEWQGDLRIALFVQLRAGRALDGALEGRIREQLRRGASPRHVPALILPVSAIPYTRSGKKVELAVREVIHGRPVRNADALANPEVLPQYRQRIEESTQP